MSRILIGMLALFVVACGSTDINSVDDREAANIASDILINAAFERGYIRGVTETWDEALFICMDTYFVASLKLQPAVDEPTQAQTNKALELCGKTLQGLDPPQYLYDGINDDRSGIMPVSPAPALGGVLGPRSGVLGPSSASDRNLQRCIDDIRDAIDTSSSFGLEPIQPIEFGVNATKFRQRDPCNNLTR